MNVRRIHRVGLVTAAWLGVTLFTAFFSVILSGASAFAEIQVGDSVEVSVDGAKLHLRDKSIEKLAQGTAFEVAKLRDDWIGGYAITGGEKKPGWILKSQVREAAPASLSPEIKKAVAALEAKGVTFEFDAAGLPYEAEGKGAKVTDADMANFEPLTSLLVVNLELTKIGDEGFKHLAKLGSLQRLYVDGTKITGKSLELLKNMPDLEMLSLGKLTELKDDDLKLLAPLKELQSLNLEDSPVTDACLQYIAPLTNLNSLTLSRTKITGSGFKDVADMKNIITLTILELELEQDALDQLHDWDKMKILRCEGAKLPEDDVEELDEAVPSLAIFD